MNPHDQMPMSLALCTGWACVISPNPDKQLVRLVLLLTKHRGVRQPSQGHTAVASKAGI